SPKLKEWHQSLINNVSEQLNPPKPPRSLNASYIEATEKINNLKSDGLKRIGYWAVAGEVGGIPKGLPSGKEMDIYGKEAKDFFSAGEKAWSTSEAKTHLKDYTGVGYKSMNSALRYGYFD